MPLQKARLKISDYSLNHKGRARDHARKVVAVSLSLTSMVDMFAILVIFLLANNNTVEEWVKLEHDITLPQAHVLDEPQKGTTLQISKEFVFDENNGKLIKTTAISKDPASLRPVANWLKKNAKKQGYVNLVADRDVPFGAMKQIIATCQTSGHKNVNLAVLPR